MKRYLESARFEAITAGFGARKILVIGDPIADEFLVGEVSRISREAPVLILKHHNTELIPGGAGNAAANAASLGGTVDLLGAVGQDRTADRLRSALAECRVGDALVADPSRPTTTKTRISACSQQSVTQQIVRVDIESNHPLDEQTETRVLEALDRLLPTIDAVLVSDYGNGFLTDRVVEHLVSCCRKAWKILTVDSQDGLHRFPGASAVTPNQPEAEAAVGFRITDRESLLRAGAAMLELSKAQAVLITRGANGIALFERGKPLQEIPAFNRSEVFDVTGAGDTVIATFTMALSAGASFLEATALANLAASIVVRRFGTSTTDVPELGENYRKLLERSEKNEKAEL